MKYIIDTSALIDLKDVYRKNVFPDAWKNVEQRLADGTIASCYEVYAELKAKEGDDIFRLVNPYPDIFIQPTKQIQLKMKEVLAKYPGLLNIRSGKSGADPFVIATALVHKVPVVTNEKKTGNLSSPHIPDVCHALGHHCYSLVQLFEKEEFSFVNQE